MTPALEELNVHDAAVAYSTLTTRCLLDGLVLDTGGQPLEPGRAVLASRVVAPDQ